MSRVFQAAVAVVFAFTTSQVASAAIMLSINPTPVVVTEGTPTASFDVVVSSATNDAFASFSLAFGVGDGGTTFGQATEGNNPLIQSFTLGSLFTGTAFTFDFTTGGPGKAGMLVEMERPDGDTTTIVANGVLGTITLDTSAAVAGQSFVLNPNFNMIGDAANNSGGSFALTSTDGSLQISAGPEPSSLGLLACAAGVALQRRRRS